MNLKKGALLMGETNSRVISVQWDGPYKQSDLVNLNNEQTDYGIYQIYGHHPVYGENVLLYIGEANQQTFCTRLMQHAYWFEEEFTIYVGRLCGVSTPSEEDWAIDIHQVESMLIYVHTPAYNTVNINSINETALQDVHIINLGKYKSLLPEVSGARWIGEPEIASLGVHRYL